MELKNIYLKEIKSNNMENQGKPKPFNKKWQKFIYNTPIIQVGIGGPTSSGKTYLIESMLSFFKNGTTNGQPFYMDSDFNNNNIVLTKRHKKNKYFSFFENLYSSVYAIDPNGLVSRVNTNWVSGIQTATDSTWNGSTYFLILQSGKAPEWWKLWRKDKTKCIIVFRNIAGEIFKTYYTNIKMTSGDNKSLDELFTKHYVGDDAFKEYFGNNDEYKNIFKMTDSSFGHDETKKNVIDKFGLNNNDNDKLKEAFFDYVKTKATIPATELETMKKHFYEYLSFVTSDVKIACMRCVKLKRERNDDEKEQEGKKEAKESDINKAIIDLHAEDILVCITQFDKLIKEGLLPELDVTKPKINLSDIFQSWNNFYHIDKNTAEKNLFKLIDKTIWENENEFGDIENNYYLTSVSYNKDAKCFYKFPNSGETTNVWTNANKSHHTPIGVFELVHKILAVKDFELKNIGISQKDGEKFPEIWNRLGKK